MTPATKFAQSKDITFAYQVFGDGPGDMVIIPGWLSNLDIFWEEPRVARFFLALAQFTRVFLIDCESRWTTTIDKKSTGNEI